MDTVVAQRACPARRCNLGFTCRPGTRRRSSTPMASADSTRTAGCSGPHVPGPAASRADRGDLGVTIAMTGILAIGSLMLLAPIVRAVVPITVLPDPFLDHHQDAETLLFLAAFVVVLPASVWAVSRTLARVSAGPNGDAISALAALLTAGLVLVLLVARATSEAMLSLGAGVWVAGAIATLVRAAAPSSWEGAARLAPLGSRLWVATAVLLGGSAFAFTAVDSISWPLLLSLGALTAVFIAGRERLRAPTAGARIGLLADAAVPVVLVLAVPNVVVFATGGGAESAFQTAVIQFHQNFFLGPANQVLAGDAMLVDTLSQYGVGSIYFLAGAFGVVPIGNGTLGLIEGTLSALMFIGAWGVMRIAGVSRPLGLATMAVAVVALVYGLQYPVGGLLQHGAIRFGLPIGVIVGAAIESRWAGAASAARLLQLTTLAVASIWALEAFAYVLFTLLAVAALQVFLAPPATRFEGICRWIAQMAAACLAAHALLAAATVIAAGQLPDWGWYLNTLREFLFGQIGDLTYDFSPWSPGLALGGAYLVSAIAIVVLLTRRPDIAQRQRTLLVAIVGMTAFGVALFSYIVNRSGDHIVPYVCLPALALGALWITLLERRVVAAPAAGRRVAWTLGLAISALLIAVAGSSVETRFSQSALAHVLPGGSSLPDALRRLWNPPPLRPAAAEGQMLLEDHMPGERRSSVITSADLSVEILLRSERGSAVPLGDPWEDSFVPYDHLEPLGEYVEGLEPGERLLIDGPAREAFLAYRRNPARDPLARAERPTAQSAGGLAVLQEWTLNEIGGLWDLETVARSPSGLEVVELAPR